MLASTVQFSKNNQIHLLDCERRPDPLTRRFIRGKWPITERHKKRVPSGPNSVPICSLSPLDTFPRRQACSTHCRNNRTISQPASTNEPYPASSAGVGLTAAQDIRSRSTIRCSLERR